MSEPTFYTHTPMYYQEGTVTDYGIVQKIEYVNNGVFAVYCKSAQQSVQRMGLWARLKKWFGANAHR